MEFVHYNRLTKSMELNRESYNKIAEQWAEMNSLNKE
jgi:hypothetical protein